MMTVLLKKIRNNNGESIAETLIALLVAALGLIILASAINSTSRIITSSNNKIKEYNAKDLIVVQQEVETDSKIGEISFDNEKVTNESDSHNINIYVFVNDVMNSNEVISFVKKVGVGD